MNKVISQTLASLLLTLMATALWAGSSIEYEVTGIQSSSIQENIHKRLKIQMTEQANQLNRININHYLKQGKKEIALAVEPYGYFKPLIQTNAVNDSGNHWILSYHVELGLTLPIRAFDVDIQGNAVNQRLLRNLIKQLPTQVGQPFNSITYKKSKERISAFLLEHGFLQAKFVSHKVLVNRKRYSAIIHWHIDMGPRFRFGETTFKGSLLNPSLLQAYVEFHAGQFYQESAITDLQTALMGSGYFDNVLIIPDIKHANARHEVPILIQLTPTRSRHYQVGMGFGTDTGYRGLAAMQIRPLNHSGHQLMLASQLSYYTEEASVSYIIPGARPAIQHYAVNGLISSEDNDQGNSETVSVGALYSNIWRRMFHTIWSLKYQIARSQLVNEPRYNTHLLIPSLNLHWTQSNHPTNPSEGYNLNILWQGSDKRMGSTLSFFQSIVQLKWLIPLSPSSNQELVMRGALGYTATNEQSKLPLQYQFYVGGSQSIRGYAYNAIGPGPDFFTASFEVRQRIHGDLYAGIFTDMGNTSDSIHMRPKKTLGVSMTYQSIAGNISASIARPVHETFRDIRFQFSMSPEF